MTLTLKNKNFSKKRWIYLCLFIFFSLFLLSNLKRMILELLYLYQTFNLISTMVIVELIFSLGLPIIFLILLIESKKK